MMLLRSLMLTIIFFGTQVILSSQDVTVVENPSAQSSFVEASIKLGPEQSVTWFISPEPTKQVEVDNVVYFNGPPGVYKVTAIIQSVVGKKIVNKKVKIDVTIIGGPIPVPDAFKKLVQQAFDLEPALDKANSTAKLAALYRSAAKLSDPTVQTNGQLFEIMKVASRTLLAETAIPKIRAEIGKRLNPIFGSPTAALDRPRIAAEFNAIADALEAVK